MKEWRNNRITPIRNITAITWIMAIRAITAITSIKPCEHNTELDEGMDKMEYREADRIVLFDAESYHQAGFSSSLMKVVNSERGHDILSVEAAVLGSDLLNIRLEYKGHGAKGKAKVIETTYCGKFQVWWTKPAGG